MFLMLVWAINPSLFLSGHNWGTIESTLMVCCSYCDTSYLHAVAVPSNSRVPISVLCHMSFVKLVRRNLGVRVSFARVNKAWFVSESNNYNGYC